MSHPTTTSLFPWHSRIIFSLALILTLVVWLTGYNQNLFLFINHQHSLIPDQVWLALNFISYSRYFVLAFVLLLIAKLYNPRYLINCCLVISAYYFLFPLLKFVVAEARPFVVLDPNSFYWLNHFENASKSAYLSFPSGHTGNIAVFAFTLNIILFDNKKGLQFLMLLLVILTALARICTGWHWPLDVMASGLIGYVLVKLSFIINWTPRKLTK